jgi:hypothetical protein
VQVEVELLICSADNLPTNIHRDLLSIKDGRCKAGIKVITHFLNTDNTTCSFTKVYERRGVRQAHLPCW